MVKSGRVGGLEYSKEEEKKIKALIRISLQRISMQKVKQVVGAAEAALR